MTDEITPARLRELAHIFDPASQTAAALRAAAHELELAEETAREGAKERLEADAHYRATLAAREALLARMVAAYDKANPMRRADFHPPTCGCLRCEMDTARALAAEIAAALGKETDNDRR